MHASIRALMTGIIDYAGMFPPAKLPLETAMPTYLTAKRASANRRMLGRMVCPTTELTKILDLDISAADMANLAIAALGHRASSEQTITSTFDEDLGHIWALRESLRMDGAIGIYEFALPAGVTALPSGFTDLLRREVLTGFVEVPFGPNWVRDFDALTATIAPGTLGLKLRCGGLTADAFPADAYVAHFIHRVSARQLVWKATAGLHHPRRHWDAKLGVWHHGFLNVFVAGILTRLHRLTERDIASIIADRDGAGLKIDNDSITWKTWSATTEQIRTLRETAATSFGSCSFDEPCQDLSAMGLLDT